MARAKRRKGGKASPRGVARKGLALLTRDASRIVRAVTRPLGA